MNITEFCRRYGLRHHGTATNSWDAFGRSGVVLMQLWQGPNQRVRDHPVIGAYLRVRCFRKADFDENYARRAVGYGGRRRSIKAMEEGALGFAAISAPPSDEHGPGNWAKYADLARVFPILAIEREADGDVYAVLGAPVPATKLINLESTADRAPTVSR